MTSDQLVAIAGVILSLLMAYVPKLNEWYAALSGPAKRLLMAGLLFVVAAGAFGLSCWPAAEVSWFTCTKKDAIGLVWLFLEALVANQGTYLLAVRPKPEQVP